MTTTPICRMNDEFVAYTLASKIPLLSKLACQMATALSRVLILYLLSFASFFDAIHQAHMSFVQIAIGGRLLGARVGKCELAFSF